MTEAGGADEMPAPHLTIHRVASITNTGSLRIAATHGEYGTSGPGQNFGGSAGHVCG